MNYCVLVWKCVNFVYFSVQKSGISVFLVSAENGAGVNKKTNITYMLSSSLAAWGYNATTSMRGNWAETWTNLKLNPSQSRHRSEPQFNPPSEFYFNSFTTREGFSETISILICLLWIGIGVEYWKWYEMQFRPQNHFTEKCGSFLMLLNETDRSTRIGQKLEIVASFTWQSDQLCIIRLWCQQHNSN